MINQGSQAYKLISAIAKRRGMQPREYLHQLLLEEYKRIFKKEYLA